VKDARPFDGHAVQCGVCEGGLDLRDAGVLVVTVTSVRSETRQEIYAHAACLGACLADATAFDPALFEPDA
jgi:hypothetical protein